MGDIVTIEVLSWTKFQHNHGKKTFDWFKVPNTLFDDPEIESLTDLQFRCWIRILSLCARRRSAEVKVSLTLLRPRVDITLTCIRRALNRFEEFQWVRVISGALEEKRIEENRIETTYVETSFDECVESKKADPNNKLAEIWNKHCGSLPKVQNPTKLSDGRSKKAKARWKDKPDEAYWTEIIKRMASSKFCNGKEGSGSWKATFDFLIKPDTHTKVLEGQYGCLSAVNQVVNWDSNESA